MNLYRPKLIEDKSNQELKDGIIQELRLLMVNFRTLVESENRIRKIQISKFLLDERKDGVFDEIDKLEKQTKWKFTELFSDCISYPDKSIYPTKYYPIEVKENSVCEICEEFVNELTNKEIKICNKCLIECRNSLENELPLEGCLLFKTPVKEYWCKHASEDTLLLSVDKYYIGGSSIICGDCIKEEEIRRE